MKLVNLNKFPLKYSPQIKGWLKFGIGVFLIWFSVFVLAPWMQQINTIQVLHEHIRENNIKATALYYTEIEEFDDADSYMRDALKY